MRKRVADVIRLVAVRTRNVAELGKRRRRSTILADCTRHFVIVNVPILTAKAVSACFVLVAVKPSTVLIVIVVIAIDRRLGHA